jgi:hypothetical protein
VKLRSSRDKQIIELRSQGMTLEAIGQQFGLTKERVRQILSRYEIPRCYETKSDLMARFRVGWYEIDQAMKAAGVFHQAGRRRRYALSDTDVATIREQLEQRETRQCRICGRSFRGGRSGKRLCSPECFRAYRRQRRQVPPSELAMRNTTRQIQELLAAEPAGSTWVKFNEALPLSGMSRTQLSRLRVRGLIACKPSGKRSVLYSARHCEAIRRFIKGAGEAEPGSLSRAETLAPSSASPPS